MNGQKFFRCNKCGNLVGMILSSGAPMMCCGQAMEELLANTTDAATEKHIPCVTTDGHTVHVAIGSVPHPMIDEHHIEFIYLLTKNGGQMKRMSVGNAAEADFALANDTVVAAYEYCNLHGLWKIDL